MNHHTMTGAWALNALADDENTAVEQHLRECETCALEAVELRETAARLSVLVEVAPPPYLRERVLAATRTTRQQPPGPPMLTPLALKPLARRKKQWGRKAAVLVAAASVLGLAGGGVAVNVALSNEVSELRPVAAQYQQLNTLMSAPGAKTVSMSAADGGTGMAVFSPTHNKVLFLAAGMPALPSDRSYQLWLVDGEGPHSVGVFETADGSMTMDLVPGVDKLALTVEPRGGSAGPTTAPIVSLPYA